MSQLGPFLQAACQNRMGSLEWYSEAALQTSLSWKLEKTKQRSHTENPTGEEGFLSVHICKRGNASSSSSLLSWMEERPDWKQWQAGRKRHGDCLIKRGTHFEKEFLSSICGPSVWDEPRPAIPTDRRTLQGAATIHHTRSGSSAFTDRKQPEAQTNPAGGLRV